MTVSRVATALIALVLLAACVVVPPASAPSDTIVDYIDDAALYRLFEMCRAAWRRREHYLDSEWRLNYLYDTQTNTLVLLIEEDDTLYVVFRGSQVRRSEADRRYNTMLFRRRPGFGDLARGVRTHIGFTTKYLGIRDAVLSAVDSSGQARIVTAGHSAGGALAKLAFVDLLEREPRRIAYAVTFGAPRVFNRAGARSLEPYRQRIIRVVNGADIVTRLPTALFGYRHVGTRIDVSERNGLRIASQYDHDSGYAESLQARALAADIILAD